MAVARPKSPSLKVGAKSLNVSNLSKILFPATGFTKGEVIAYYLKIADVLLPHLKGRALTLKRYPNGVDAGFFYEKRCPDHRPDWVSTVILPSDRRGTLQYCSVDSAATLGWVANLASIELHALLSRGKNYNRPMWMVFDLDPGAPATILDCVAVAQKLRKVLQGVGLESWVKTSGGKGLHLWVPLNTAVTFDDTKTFSRAVAETLERDDPARVTSNMSKAGRNGKVFIDWSQNDEHKTTAVVYSLRAREQPNVSTPISWKELETLARAKVVDAFFFSPDDVIKRTQRLGDLFAPVLTVKQKLPS